MVVVEDCRIERDRTIVVIVGGGRRVKIVGYRGSRVIVYLSTIVGNNEGLWVIVRDQLYTMNIIGTAWPNYRAIVSRG